MDAKISILPFPQRLTGNRLHLRILTMPRNFSPLADDALNALSPAWVAPANLQLEARVFDSLDEYPRLDLTPSRRAALPGVGIDAAASDIFTALEVRMPVKSTARAGKPGPTDYARKYLPESYRSAFHFTGPRTPFAALDDSYQCAVRKNPEPNPTFKPDYNTMSWGKIFAFCLRQPALAKKCGFIHETFIDLTPGLLENGGWLYVDFAAGSDYAADSTADPTFAKRYAARIPKLTIGEDRPVFAAILFPVLIDAAGPGPDKPEQPSAFDELLIEAAEYDNGFAKIVHANQPVNGNHLEEKPDPEHPVTNDGGIRLGWDDEQLLIWMNRQLREDDNKPGTGQRVDAPLGVFQYRVDARFRSDVPEAPNAWTCLCTVENRAQLALDDINLEAAGVKRELGVEVYPAKPDAGAGTHFWLPQYFAQWAGKSLVLQDEEAVDIFQKENNLTKSFDGSTQAAQKNTTYNPVGLDAVPLLYGRHYQFRVRLMDTTGGGPGIDDPMVYEGIAPEVDWHFRRHVVPAGLLIRNPLPERDDAFFEEAGLSIRRPRLGYPAVLFTGVYPNPVDLLKADVAFVMSLPVNHPEYKRPIGLADPDIDRVEITVEVRALDLDTTIRKADPKDPFALLYRTTRAFPLAVDDALELPLSYVDAPVLHFTESQDLLDLGLATVAGSIDALEPIVLPTARDVRITVRALCAEKPGYYGFNTPFQGLSTTIMVRQGSASELDWFKDTPEQSRIRGIDLQPEEPLQLKKDFKIAANELLLGLPSAEAHIPTLIDRLAQTIDAQSKGMSISGPEGQRWQFGASRSIRHSLAPDNTSMTFATRDDLINQWIVPITLLLDRDWTWDGLIPEGFDVYRKKKFERDTNWGPKQLVGQLETKRAVNITALTESDRTQTFLCFFDTVEPKPMPGKFPDEILLEYEIVPRLKNETGVVPPTESVTLSLHLPITTTPAQVPRIVSAGLAQTPYVRDEAYASTEPRNRYLWVEFEKPLDNPNDAFFVRMLSYTPDPLIAEWKTEWLFPAPQDPALNIDPEHIRLIAPGHSDNKSGLNAMQELLPAQDSDVHYLIPLPPGLHAHSPELFGFFTCEFRVGHKIGWSTAQGRFGRSLRMTGMQHPTPQLFCAAQRNERFLVVNAPFAQSVFDGRDMTPEPPRTQLWALLYAQVRMANDADNRNILLDDRRLVPVRIERKFDAKGFPSIQFNTDAVRQGHTRWTNKEIEYLLAQYGLPDDSELSVLCVEMLPTNDAFVTDPHKKRQEEAGFAGAGDPVGRTFETANSGFSSRRVSTESYVSNDGAGPLDEELGYHRILRTSTLTAVPPICCTEDCDR